MCKERGQDENGSKKKVHKYSMKDLYGDEIYFY